MWRSARSVAPSVHIPMEDQEGRQADHVRHYDTSRRSLSIPSDPDDYLYAKKKLKKAVLEHYRYVYSLTNPRWWAWVTLRLTH